MQALERNNYSDYQNFVEEGKVEVLFTFDKDYAEIYIGGKAIKVDHDTAMYMIRQRREYARRKGMGA